MGSAPGLIVGGSDRGVAWFGWVSGRGGPAAFPSAGLWLGAFCCTKLMRKVMPLPGPRARGGIIILTYSVGLLRGCGVGWPWDLAGRGGFAASPVAGLAECC